MKQLLNMKEAAPNTNMAVEMIRQRLKPKSAPHIFIIINNIDGSCLRDEKCQSALCSLVSHEKIHLIASIDHLNAPLSKYFLCCTGKNDTSVLTRIIYS